LAFCFTLLIACFCACGDGAGVARPITSSSIQSVEDLLNAESTTSDDQPDLESDITTVEDAAKFLGIETTSDDIDDSLATGDPDPNVDVDLTVMSATMVYSVVYSMVTEPSSYEGKMIKMDGIFDVYTDERTGKNYYACIIQDATKCCSSGIEFELEEERIYPDEYPENGSFITVSGVFETYEEDGILYCTLRNAKMM
jgi:hypothetical protein